MSNRSKKAKTFKTPTKMNSEKNVSSSTKEPEKKKRRKNLTKAAINDDEKERNSDDNVDDSWTDSNASDDALHDVDA